MDLSDAKGTDSALGMDLEPEGPESASWPCPVLTVSTGASCQDFAGLSFLIYKMGPSYLELL